MEKFENNKIFGDIFCRYLKYNFKYSYKSVEPYKKIVIPNDYPDIDIVLISKKKDNLYLQLKQPIEMNGRVKKIMAKSSIKCFSIQLKDAIKKAETKYIKQGKNINNVILILHIHGQHGYLIPEDAIIAKIKNKFRGIYIVSPEFGIYGQHGIKKIKREFVKEIKKAF